MSSKLKESVGYKIVHKHFTDKGNKPFLYQEKVWNKINQNYNGVVVAPTGFGKTYSVFLGVVIDYLNHPQRYKKGLKLLWISPLRSLAKDLAKAMTAAVEDIGLDWTVEVRNGDTSTSVRRKQERAMPDILLTTPETIHLLFSQKNNSRWFKNLNCIAVDEWHELLGSKRGVLTELAIARFKHLSPKVKVWGLTATIGNLEVAKEVLIPNEATKSVMITAKQKKKIKIVSVLPDKLEVLPWSGHLGGSMASKIVPIINENTTTLIFTNTRGQSEMWYQILLDAAPDLAGQLAIHHGSIDAKLRNWIEDSISEGKLKAVICTSSLDLGVDFKPVDCIIQIGSSKGIARFMQRAGRSGHSPYETSKIYFVPTHSLELIEVTALKEAVKKNEIESRHPMVLCYDVMIQFLVTLSVGEGFERETAYQILKESHAFSYLTREEFDWAILFITKGGTTLKSYEDFHRVVLDEVNIYKVKSRKISMLHRLNIGAIVSDSMLRVKFMSGGYIGMIEEYFISKLKPNASFILAGRVLQMVKIKDMTVIVKSSKAKKAITPSWVGGRVPLTSHLSHFLRIKLSDALSPGIKEQELKFLHPLMLKQNQFSHIPNSKEFLVEQIETRDGFHVFMYPFEGRLVHEVMATVVSYRLSKIKPLTFTIAMNDYGFELLSDQPIPLDDRNIKSILSKENLTEDINASINATEMASRKFRDIAVISGLVIQTRVGKQQKTKSLQSSSSIIFKVLEDYEPDNLLLRQAYTEVFDHQLEEVRLREAFERIDKSTIVMKKPNQFTPLSFPIKVDSLRNTLSNESLEKRIERIQKQAMKG